MNPILFDKNETSFNHNGYGRLFPISCEVEEERNGKYEAELEISDSDKHYHDIEQGSILGLQVSDGSIQLFRIYKIEKEMDEAVKINAAHISYDLSYIPVAPIQNALGIQEALTRWKSNSLVSNPFNIDTDIVSEAAYSMNHPLSARAYLGGTEGSFLDKWHGEYEFDNYDVFLHESRGSNNGITIRYGKNLTSLEDEESIEDSADGILPYWTDGKFYVMGSIARKSQGNKILSIDVSADITLEEGQTMPTVEEVNSKGAKYLTALVTGSKQNIKVSWYEDNSISDVQLCDIVNVIYDPYSINVEMKVTKTIWNVLEEHYEEVELGEYRSFVKTLSEMSTDISNLKYNDNQMVVRLERTEDGIEAEVTRATTQEGILSTQIGVTAEGLRSEVSRATQSEGALNTLITQTASQIRLDVSQEIADDIDDYDRTVNGYLALYVAKDDNNQVVSMIEAASDYINFTANNMFTVTSQNFSVDHSGNIAAVGAELNDRVTFNAFNPSTGEYDDTKGYIGIVTYGLGSGFGMRNNSNTVGIVFPDGTSYDWLWMGANNGSINFTGTELQPWSSGVNLGSNYHKWNWVVCDNISCANPPWGSSDKRMKDVHGTIDKVREFYMALEPLKYTFKKGVDNENPNKMHYGLIAQDVLKTYEKCYNSNEQGIVKKQKIIDEGTINVIGEDEKYVINYDELHAFHIAMIQDLQAEIESLKSEIKSLRKEIKR